MRMGIEMGGLLEIDAAEMMELSRGFRAEGQRMAYRGRPEGTSMWPLVRGGDGIVVEQAAEGDIRVGDILVFWGGGAKLIAHRLVRIDCAGGEKRYRMRGDFRRRMDKPVGYEAIVGRVAAIERGGKTIRTNSAGFRLKSAAWATVRPAALLARAAWKRVWGLKGRFSGR